MHCHRVCRQHQARGATACIKKSQQVKESDYFPSIQYSLGHIYSVTSTFGPHKMGNIYKLEQAQWRATKAGAGVLPYEEILSDWDLVSLERKDHCRRTSGGSFPLNYGMILYSHKITEWLMLEETSEDLLVQLPCSKWEIRLIWPMISWVLSISRDGNSTSTLGNLFQCWSLPR